MNGFLFMLVLVVAIVTIGDIIKKRDALDSRKTDSDELAQIQADLNELKKRVVDIQEYVTDLYIQQHDHKQQDDLK